jgi:hypothetical protein
MLSILQDDGNVQIVTATFFLDNLGIVLQIEGAQIFEPKV